MTANVTRFLMQSEADAARIQALGAAPQQTLVSGNIKYDIGQAKDAATMNAKARVIEADFALSRTPLVVAGSSCDGEEELILAAFTELRKEIEDVRLLIAPRHPERFDAVAKILDSSRFKSVRRSALVQQVETVGVGNLSSLPATKNPAHTADIILLDSIGELASLYRFASVVFVGGSLVPKGGHNILEPALDAKPIIVGPHMENFREIASEFLRHDAVIQLQGTNDSELIAALNNAMLELLTNEDRARNLGQCARATVEANRGATAKTVEVIATLI